jgi:hypothetical protein
MAAASLKLKATLKKVKTEQTGAEAGGAGAGGDVAGGEAAGEVSRVTGGHHSTWTRRTGGGIT